jgi:hypothetical protein
MPRPDSSRGENEDRQGVVAVSDEQERPGARQPRQFIRGQIARTTFLMFALDAGMDDRGAIRID